MKTITLEFKVQMTKTFTIPKDKERLVEIVMRPCTQWTMEEAEIAFDYDLYQFVAEQMQLDIDDISNISVEDFED